jgi:hypothetical protein
MSRESRPCPRGSCDSLTSQLTWRPILTLMRRTAGSRFRTLLLVLPLGVMLALPEVRWCQLAWADLAKCLAYCPTPVSCTASTAVACEALEACGPAVESSAACDASCESDPSCSGPSATSSEKGVPSGRAWCPGETEEGTLPHGPDVGDPHGAPTPAPVDLGPPAPSIRRGFPAVAVAIPPSHSPHAPPPIRAPPLG